MSHTKEPWEVDHRECDCVRYFVVIGPDGKTIMDTMNSESQLIEEEFDEDGFRDQWDEQGRLDLNRAAQCVNACEGIADPSVIPGMIAALREYQLLVRMIASQAGSGVVHLSLDERAAELLKKVEVL